jgi:hypothetical protein
MAQEKTLKQWEILESDMCMCKQGTTDTTGCFNSNLYCTPVARKAAQVGCLSYCPSVDAQPSLLDQRVNLAALYDVRDDFLLLQQRVLHKSRKLAPSLG